MTKRRVATRVKARSETRCRVFGARPKGLGAALFPDRVVFTFTVLQRTVDVTGFVAVGSDVGSTKRSVYGTETEIPKRYAATAKKKIFDEYGNRWTLTTADVS